jgi:two-component system, cell cycle response regulator DivK
MSAIILIVDDHPVNLKLASRVLEFQGYCTLQAARAEEAQAVLAQARPHLILMDLALPGMDGLTLTRQLKAEPATQSIPVVAMTAFAMTGDAAKAVAAGCEGYLTKPIDTRKLPGQVAGCAQVYEERARGKTTRRPQRAACLQAVRAGDALIVRRPFGLLADFERPLSREWVAVGLKSPAGVRAPGRTAPQAQTPRTPNRPGAVGGRPSAGAGHCRPPRRRILDPVPKPHRLHDGRSQETPAAYA